VQWRYAVEEAFSRAEGDRCDMCAELVDEAGGEVLVMDSAVPLGFPDDCRALGHGEELRRGWVTGHHQAGRR
jgi:hypothetical protein